MRPSPNCFALIKSQEGCILHPYLDQAGVPSIGWGTTIYPNGQHVTMKDEPISQGQADTYMQHAISAVAVAVTAMVPESLSQNQFDALVDFAYNVGTGALHGSTALKLIKANPNDPGIRTTLALWDKIHVNGALEVSPDLAKRRRLEAEMYFS